MHRLASRINGILLLSTLALLLGCQGKHGGNPIDGPGPGGSAAIVDVPPVIASDNGYVSGMLGAWSWVSDRSIPERGRLEPVRFTAQEQGDLYSLSIQAFLTTDSLKLISATPVADGMEYTLRFKHPIPLPTDLVRPSTASKRLDLFLFDVQLLIARNGSDSYFGGVVTTDIDLVQDPDGFRRPGPIVDLPSLGITSADTFPYRLLTLNNPADPRGNYDSIGWDGAEYLSARGFDVIPQGATVTTSLIGPAEVPFDTKIILLAKYMDPRSGATIDELRANRLPDPLDSTAFQYYLPEAAGDLEHMIITTSGSLLTEGADDVATLDINILDWDHQAPIAVSFPNPAKPREIRQASAPISLSASFPDLSSTPFTGATDGLVTGLAGEWISKTLEIRNVSQTLELPIGESLDVDGLVRVLDQQDDAPGITLLDESLTPVTPPGSFRPSTRYQRATIRVSSGKLPPTILSVDPTAGSPGEQASFVAVTKGPAPTSWLWSFGGGATPNTSTEMRPLVTLSGEGTYNATVTATNAYGTSAPFPFTLAISTVPQVTKVLPGGWIGWPGDVRGFSFEATGGPFTAYAWTFNGGVTPSTSTLANPIVTLTEGGTFSGEVRVSNVYGPSAPFAFNYEIDPGEAPDVFGIGPIGNVGVTGDMRTFSAAATGHPTSWSWNFDGGAIPNIVADPTPFVALGTAGSYTGMVTVQNPFGQTTEPFNFTVLAPPAPPTVQSVAPLGTVGTPSSPVSFSAIATNNPTSWSWSFGGGAIPNISSAASPDVLLGNVGTYNGSVTAINALGSSAPFPFSFTVGNPPKPVIQSVSPTGAIGAQGQNIEFSAVILNAPENFMWDFGGGADPNTSTEASPIITLGAPGSYTGSLVASNGSGSSTPFEFEFSVVKGSGHWGRNLEGFSGGFSNVTGLVVDPSGSVYLSGQYQGTNDFSPGPTTVNRTTDLVWNNSYVWSLNELGYLDWVETAGEEPALNGFLNMVQVTPTQLQALMVFRDQTHFNLDGPEPAQSYDTQGSSINHWVSTAYGTDGSYPGLGLEFYPLGPGLNTIEDLAPGTGATFFGTGYSEAAVTWGSTDTWPGSAFLFRAQSDNTLLWTRNWSTDLRIQQVLQSPAGDILLGAGFKASQDMDPGPGVYTINGGAYSGFESVIISLNDDGEFQWASSLESDVGQVQFRRLVADSTGNVHVVGNVYAAADFDPGPGVVLRAPVNEAAMFHLVLNDSGQYVSVDLFDGTGGLSPQALAIDANDHLYLGGYFEETADFDPGPGTLTRTSSNALDGFLMRLDVSGSPQWVETYGSTGEDAVYFIVVQDDALYFAGQFAEAIDIQPGSGETLLQTNQLSTMFIVKMGTDGTF